MERDMTPQEFKAWFDGFTEAVSGPPNKTQWTRIKARIAEIDGNPITERVYIDRYLPSYTPTWVPYWTVGGVGVSSTTYCASVSNTVGMNSFNSSNAMANLGRAEALSIAA